MRQRPITRFTMIVLALFLVLAMAACADFTRNTYRALTVSFTGYDTVLSGMGDLYREKLITDQVRDQAIKYGKAYKLAHNGAVNALAKYEETGGEQNKQAVTAALTDASKALAQLISYCKPYLVKYGKEVPVL